MGDKVRGGKKAKTAKVDGNRPHEQRQKDALANEAGPRQNPKAK